MFERNKEISLKEKNEVLVLYFMSILEYQISLILVMVIVTLRVYLTLLISQFISGMNVFAVNKLTNILKVSVHP